MRRCEFDMLLSVQRWRDYPQIVRDRVGGREVMILKLWRTGELLGVIHQINMKAGNSGARIDRLRRHYNWWLSDWYCKVDADAEHFHFVIVDSCWKDGDRG